MHPRLVILAGAILTGCIVLLATRGQDATPLQTSTCVGCGQAITERTRKPCGTCGSMNRLIAVFASDRIGVADRVN